MASYILLVLFHPKSFLSLLRTPLYLHCVGKTWVLVLIGLGWAFCSLFSEKPVLPGHAEL